MMKIRVLFICLGNICRSPMAEAIMHQLVEDAGLGDRIEVDSVGIGDWHVGQPPHRGTQEILKRHGIPYAGSARQITRDDLEHAAYLIAMDQDNVADVHRLDRSGKVRDKLHRLLEFAPPAFPEDVPDPYFHGNFDETYHLVSAGCRGLLEHIRATHRL